MREIEPNLTGVGALLSRETAIVSYRQICEKMADLLRADGADFGLARP
ncbi:hypothetical protein [Mesorhizobium sp. CN2-181]